MNTRFIVNPASGKPARNRKIVRKIEAHVRQNRDRCSIVFSQSPAHATQLSAQAVAAGSNCVVSVGGDGTMNEVAQSLVGTDAILSLIPCGSGNGLGRHLGIPRDTEEALRILRTGVVTEIDTGRVNDLPFFNVMGAGFDAEISRRFNPLRRRGLLSYFGVSAAAFFNYRPERYRVSNGSWKTTTEAWIISVANSSQYGNDACIAPRASTEDGLLDLVAIHPRHRASVASLALRLFTGTLDKSPAVTSRQGKEFVIERSKPGLLHTDGETHECGARLHIRVLPKSLKILVPGTSARPLPTPLGQ